MDSGNEELDRYIREHARQDAERRVAAAFVLTQPGSPSVLGFYALSASFIPMSELPPLMMKSLPRYGQLPVRLLGRLAVDRSIRSLGIGELLLVDALRPTLEATWQTSAMAVIVDAKDKKAESFSRHFDFQPFQQTPLRLFLPMEQIARFFAKRPPVTNTLRSVRSPRLTLTPLPVPGFPRA